MLHYLNGKSAVETFTICSQRAYKHSGEISWKKLFSKKYTHAPPAWKYIQVFCQPSNSRFLKRKQKISVSEITVDNSQRKNVMNLNRVLNQNGVQGGDLKEGGPLDGLFSTFIHPEDSTVLLCSSPGPVDTCLTCSVCMQQQSSTFPANLYMWSVPWAPHLFKHDVNTVIHQFTPCSHDKCLLVTILTIVKVSNLPI